MLPETTNIRSTTTEPDISLAELTRVFGHIALLSFGGPAGQIALMHRVLVDEKKWVSERSFLHALNFCMLLPGPEAQQLATYIGWLKHGVIGGLIGGGLFIAPGVVAIMALSLVYATWGQVGFVSGAFFGLKAAVLAIVALAILRVAKRSLKDNAARALAGAAFIALFFFNAPFPLIVLGAGVIGFLAARAGAAFMSDTGHADPDAEAEGADDEEHLSAAATQDAIRAAAVFLILWLAPTALLFVTLGDADVFTQIAVFFSKMAVVTFGGAYAVLSYVAQQAVERFHWLAPAEMLDGLGMAETTPGPLIMVLQFVGFMAAYRDAGALPPLLAGALGGLLATWVTFAPCFLWIFAGAPYVERLRGNRALSGALAAISAAVVGVIANLALWFATHFLFRGHRMIEGCCYSFDMPMLASVDLAALALSAVAAASLLRFNFGVAKTLALSVVAGLLLRQLAP